MSAELPQPLVPAEVDLRDFGFMPLDVLRLRDSDLAALSSGDEFKAAVLLWCVAWHQVPAASLPNDDRLLARYSGTGALWRKVKAEALRGFVECDDGRLYHATIAEKANEAWSSKQAQRARTAAATAAREARRREQHAQRDVQRDVERDESRNDQRDVERDAQRDVVQGIGTVKGQGQGDIHPSGVVASKPRPSRKPPPDFALTPEIRAWAAEHAPQVDADAELAKMLDHTFATARTDWPGTLRNWLRKAQEDAQRERPRHAANGSAPEPQWRTEQRARTEAFAGPAAAKRTDDTERLEVLHAAPRLG